jgi:ubiquitin carboxyl-terminal hydrolase 9/24
MNIDCQIRGKSDIHEALSTMCEVEYMEGDNKVFCDNCKKNCDTILRTAISALPDVLILSLKRFDLDYNTFETVKLNSRCAFEQNLNMKKYTLEGVEAMEKASLDDNEEPFIDPLSTLPDEDYEYRLAGVLVHHGVAQGGHYYSFIRDRTKPNTAEADKWFRFDDDEVTPFDPSQIEVECFGGKVKKETKWPNGQINTVETEQLANALMLFYEKVKPSPQKTPEEEKEIAMDESEDIISDITFTTGMEIFEGDVKKSNSVHRSHAFLFDTEFQRFLRKLLDVVIVDDVQSTKLEESSIPTWRIAILELATLYFFDVLLHSVNNTTLNDWTNILSSVLATSGICSRWFVKELAKRTRSVNENWLRIFASDCPEKHSRRSAMKVIASALRCCAGHPAEVTMLKSWSQAWIQQLENGWSFDSDYIAKLPVSLIGDNQHLEDLTGMVGHGSSCVGIVISFICLLLDLAPRTWQYNSDLCFLLREIGSIRIEDGGEAMREALNASQIPARLIAILLRDKAPLKIRSALPGASMSLELAEAISKPISSPTAHIFPMNNSTGNVAVSTPLPSDHIYTLEAIAAIIGIEGAKNADLVFESEEVKGRPTYELTNEAKISLTTIFNECTSNQGLMVKQGFDDYLKACATSVSVSPQQLMSKYGNEYSNLTIDGFLSYYRDISQTSPLQVRKVIHCT